MSPYKTIDSTPSTPDYCTPSRLSRLHTAGIETDGHIDQLREIITDGGYNLPLQHGEHWGFIFRQKYTRLYLTEVDAMCEEILMLKENEMI